MSRPVRGPELSELRAFCAAVDLGSLGRAARVLHVSQPALSKRLRVLETLTGTRLLERSHRGVSPTPTGRRLYLAARRVLAEDEAVEELIAGVVNDGVPARVAASPTMAESVLPGLLVEFEGRHERHLSVELTIVSSAIVRDLVREGRVDLGLQLDSIVHRAGPSACGFCGRNLNQAQNATEARPKAINNATRVKNDVRVVSAR